MRATISSGVFRGVPTFFKATCRQIADRSLKLSYQYAGEQLAGHLEGLVPFDMEEDEWLNEVERFVSIVTLRKFDEVIAWLEARFPACMALIPPRRRQAFMQGVYETLKPQ